MDLERLETPGRIDSAERQADNLLIQGWFSLPTEHQLLGFEVGLCGGWYETDEFLYEMPRADVAEQFPFLPRAATPGFGLRVRPPAEILEKCEDTLVQVVPRCGEKRGRKLFCVLDPSLPQPPSACVDSVGGDFNVGLDLLGELIDLADLQPEHRVLDVGCGVGRLAWPLAYYLGPKGSYSGFDPDRKNIAWAQEHIAGNRESFDFTHVDLRNAAYNPKGSVEPTSFTFAYPEDSFDIAAATSVFTHMRGTEVRRYLDQLVRVLAPGGRCLLTAYLLNDESRERIRAGEGAHEFSTAIGDGFTAEPDLPESVMAYDEGDFLAWATASGLELQTIHHGAWCRPRFTPWQDLLVLRKP